MNYSTQEIEAYAQMQARLVALLLRHDEPRFSAYYLPRADFNAEHDQALEPYRQLAVLFALRDELFEHILPRIVRRLSFESPRHTVIEEPPPRGRVDWERTLAATWDEQPGEPPLALHTRQRQRDFATPENLLTVATLLEYAADVNRLLWGEYAVVGSQALRHPLGEIAQRCERELAFPQFAGIRAAAQQVIEVGTLPVIEAQVHERLIPGGNSAYEELLAWRTRYHTLRLLQRVQRTLADGVLGADPERDNYLYQLWLYYELADLLNRAGAILHWERKTAQITFTWGAGKAAGVYLLSHDRAIANDLKVWQHTPGVRPDFYIAQRDRQEVRDDDGTVIWRAPGYLLDAKYHRPHDDNPNLPADPIKRMIADLQLSGERYGELLFAFYGSSPEAGTVAAPEWRKAQRVAPDSEVGLYCIRPASSNQSAALEQLLTALLERVHSRLQGQAEVRCHGVFLDTLGATAHGVIAAPGSLLARNGRALPGAPDDLLLCAKPHIAAWRVDLVSVTHDCCANAVLCHIKHLPGVNKPRRLTVLEEIADTLKTAMSGLDTDAAIQAATRQVVQVTRRYAQLLQPRIADYRQWIAERLEIDDLFETSPLLNDTQRETLALGRFLWEQIEQIRASNFAGPVLLFSGVLEELARTTFYRASPTLRENNGRALPQTLGALGNCKGFGGTNWAILEPAILGGQYWKPQIITLSAWIDMLRQLSTIRNAAAHTANVDRHAFQSFVALYFGSMRTGIGLLNSLLMAWNV